MAFKAESDDIRASLSYKFKKVLNGQARAVLTTDPFVTTDPDLRPFDEVIAASDLLILCAPHAAYRTADFKGKPVFDVWGMLENAPDFANATLVPSIRSTAHARCNQWCQRLYCDTSST